MKLTILSHRKNHPNELDMIRVLTLLAALIICGCNKISTIDVIEDSSRTASATGFHLCHQSQNIYGKPVAQIRFSHYIDKTCCSRTSDRQQKDLMRLSVSSSLE